VNRVWGRKGQKRGQTQPTYVHTRGANNLSSATQGESAKRPTVRNRPKPVGPDPPGLYRPLAWGPLLCRFCNILGLGLHTRQQRSVQDLPCLCKHDRQNNHMHVRPASQSQNKRPQTRRGAAIILELPTEYAAASETRLVRRATRTRRRGCSRRLLRRPRSSPLRRTTKTCAARTRSAGEESCARSIHARA
jgi:hypothetical protein